MGEKINNLPQILVTPEREYPPRTPHTYSHLGDTALQLQFPELARIYELLPTEQGA